MGILTSRPPCHAEAELFLQGNYAAAARDGGRDDWQTYAALGLVGKARAALDGLCRFGGDGPAFYAAVTRWIDGDDDGAAAGLEPLAAYDAHARNLLALVRKPRIRVLAQLPWSRSGCTDLVTGIKGDRKFQVENVSFHPDDRPNTPYADVHRLYDADAPPDFYVCQMVEWHMLPPNLAELPCPTIGHTADYDLHVQAVHPWLQLFDELVVTDPSEWRDVRRLTAAPVSTFPKSFALPASLPPLPRRRRDKDLFLSGTVAHAYHPDKAELLHQILRVTGLRLKIINGFRPQEGYLSNVARTRLCVTYVRHPTALPTRGLEALAMGCAVVTQQGSVLTLYVGADEGVLTYDLDAGNLGAVLRHLVDNWPDFRERAERGAEVVRREFAAARVASQYFRFLTFLAARPRRRPATRYAEGLFQKRPVLKDGWLPDFDFDFSLLLKRIGVYCHARLMEAVEAGPATTHPFLDAARESVLYNTHRLKNGNTPCGEWLATVSETYRRGLDAFPRSLPLRFNFARVLLYFGGPHEQHDGLRLVDETLAEAADEWSLDVMEDVFPWDFYPQLFNYRGYFDLVTRHLGEGVDAEAGLKQFILASLQYHRGFFAPYGDFASRALDYYRRAVALDPAFPYYQYHYARELLQRGLPEDDAEAVASLERLLTRSILFVEAYELLEPLGRGVRPRLRTPGLLPFEPTIPPLPPPPDILQEVRRVLTEADGAIRQARRSIDFFESVSPEANRDCLIRPGGGGGGIDSVIAAHELESLRRRVRNMESSKFWKLRQLWFRVKRLFGLPARE